MCGRFTLTIAIEAIAERFEVAGETPAWEPHYNIAPSQPAPVVTVSAAGPREVHLMRWGLLPDWARNRLGGKSLINVRAESLRDKTGFRRLLARGRCLVPADGFYEWPRNAAGRRGPPLRFLLRDGRPFAFAGLWELDRDAAGQPVPAFSIVTTSANDTVRPVHDRMPVILPRAAEQLWLSGPDTDAAGLLDLLQPLPAEQLRAYRVSPAVNSPAHDSPECIRPLPDEPPAAPPPPPRQPTLW